MAQRKTRRDTLCQYAMPVPESDTLCWYKTWRSGDVRRYGWLPGSVKLGAGAEARGGGGG
eukprot:3941558-Rhodomonas_salina.2